MTFIGRTELKKTCGDFKPSFWRADGCKLTRICEDAINHVFRGGFCTGIGHLEPVIMEEGKYKMKRHK